mmetsp:Transcript_33540/g.83628  ORF Transcript_33540/g.83628 Transcript_33540/m.83628 type:complete len:201 (+) Transcript_33540:640-1242(+)
MAQQYMYADLAHCPTACAGVTSPSGAGLASTTLSMSLMMIPTTIPNASPEPSKSFAFQSAETLLQSVVSSFLSWKIRTASSSTILTISRTLPLSAVAAALIFWTSSLASETHAEIPSPMSLSSSPTSSNARTMELICLELNPDSKKSTIALMSLMTEETSVTQLAKPVSSAIPLPNPRRNWPTSFATSPGLGPGAPISHE